MSLCDQTLTSKHAHKLNKLKIPPSIDISIIEYRTSLSSLKAGIPRVPFHARSNICRLLRRILTPIAFLRATERI